MQTPINNRPKKYHVYELDDEKFFISDELVGANSPMTARSYIIRALLSVGESQNHSPNTAYPNYLGEHSAALPDSGYAIY